MAPMFLFVPGKSCSSRVAIVVNSLCACWRDTPGARRPNACTPNRSSRFLCREPGHARQRHPEIGVRELHPLRHDADDRRRHVVDADRPADDRRVGTVAALPDAFAEHDDGIGAGLVVLRQEVAAADRTFTETA